MSGGGKSKEVVTGYKYNLGVHLGLCLGPVDEISEIIIGERTAWSGSAVDNTTISINEPELFGGDKREGGVVGNVDLCFGGAAQVRNSYLQTFQGATCPAYRGITSALFKAFQWASGNPYFKPPWFRVARIHAGWGGTTSTTSSDYSEAVMFPWVEDGDDPRACLNDHEYSFNAPSPTPDSAWGTLEEALAAATAYYGYEPVYYAGWSSDSSNLHGFGSDVEAGDRTTLTLQYLFQEPVAIYPESDISDGHPPCGNMTYLLSLGAPTDAPILWGGNSNQLDQAAGLLWIKSDGGLDPTGPGDWYLANNCTDTAYNPIDNVRRCSTVYIFVRRKLRTPDDPCAPRCTDAYPDYALDNTYCLIGSTAVKKGDWSPTSGSFKALATHTEASGEVTQYSVGPVLAEGDANYDDEAYWTAAYDAAVLAGTIPAGLTYSSTGTGGVSTYPRTTSNAYTRVGETIADNTAWEPDLAAIGIDMNPAHIIYQCLTDLNWGMGYLTSDIDDDSFLAAATTLYNEGFGLSFFWTEQQAIESFVQTVLDHINGSLRLNMTTGKFMLFLVRDDYDVEDLVELTVSNCTMKSFERGAYGDAANSITVVYTDREENPKPVTVHNLAAIQAQQGEVPATRNYPGIRVAALAARVAERDLALVSSNLAKASVTTNRILWNKEVGDVVALTWADRGITMLPMRIVKIDKGQLQKGEIEVELVEDVFGLPNESYTVAPETEWTDTVAAPAPVEVARAIETPYWEIVRTVPEADMNTFGDTYGFASVFAARGLGNNPINFSLAYAATSGGSYSTIGTGHFNPTGVLSIAIDPTDTSLTLEDFYDLDNVVLDADNGYLMIDDECMAVVSVNTESGAIVVRRGVLDTIPAMHLAAARVYFVVPAVAFDPTERVSGETAYYKPLPVTGLGTLPLGSAVELSVLFANRATRPYPPGKFRINTLAYPETIVDEALTISWTHRDRLAQTVDLVDESESSIGPEDGTTYTVRVTNADTSVVISTITGITGTSQVVTMSFLGNLKIELWSVRDSIASWQTHSHTFYYDNIVERVTSDGHFRTTTDGATRVLS